MKLEEVRADDAGDSIYEVRNAYINKIHFI
jgi:hypothetical protein